MNSWLPVACQKQERDLSEWNLHFAKVSLPKPKHNFVIFGWRFYFKIRNQNIKTHSEETQYLGTVHKSLGTPKIVARHYFSRVIKSLIIDPAFPYHVIYERPLIWHFDTINVAIFIQFYLWMSFSPSIARFVVEDSNKKRLVLWIHAVCRKLKI